MWSGNPYCIAHRSIERQVLTAAAAESHVEACIGPVADLAHKKECQVSKEVASKVELSTDSTDRSLCTPGQYVCNGGSSLYWVCFPIAFLTSTKLTCSYSLFAMSADNGRLAVIAEADTATRSTVFLSVLLSASSPPILIFRSVAGATEVMAKFLLVADATVKFLTLSTLFLATMEIVWALFLKLQRRRNAKSRLHLESKLHPTVSTELRATQVSTHALMVGTDSG